MIYHKTTKLIKDILEHNQVWFEEFEHEPVRTSEEAAKVRSGYGIRQGAKAIIVRIKQLSSDKKFVMLVIPGNVRFDNLKVKKYFEAKDVRFATEEEVISLTDGVLPGGVPPFGGLFRLDMVVDPSLFENEKIIFNAGDKRFSIAMRSEDYKKVVNPQIATIV